MDNFLFLKHRENNNLAMALVDLPDLVLVKIFRHLVHETNNFRQREIIDEVSLSQFTDLRSVK